MSLIGVSRYIIRALVMSVSFALFFRLCSTVAIALCALMMEWAGCYMPNIKLVTKASKLFRLEAWAIVRNDPFR